MRFGDPTRDREASGVKAGDKVVVTLELDDGYREVDMPDELIKFLSEHKLTDTFHDLNYSTRKEYARQIREAKAYETKTRRLEKIVNELGRIHK